MNSTLHEHDDRLNFEPDQTGLDSLHDDQDDPDMPAAASRERNLFSLLNLDEDASEQDIARAYKSLAVALHPDKHAESLRPAAQARFREISRAFEVLSDPHKRAVYETLGEEGLKTTWQVGHKFKSRAEPKAEYQTLARERLVEETESLVRSKGVVTCNINALGLFHDMPLRRRLATVGATNLSLKHTFRLPLTEATSVDFQALMIARRTEGAGGGNLSASIKHRLSSRTNLELTSTLLKPTVITAKVTHAPGPNSFVTVSSTARTTLVPPPLAIVVGRTVAKGITSYVTFKTGTYTLGLWGSDFAHLSSQDPPSISLGATSLKGWTVSVETATPQSSVSAEYSQKVLGDVLAKCGTAISPQGQTSFSLSAERKIGYDATLSLGLNFALSGSIMLKLRLSRLGQRMIIPILLARQLEWQIVCACIVMPSVSMTALHYLYLLPRKRRKIAEKLAELRSENAAILEEQKQAAAEAKELLAEQVARRLKVETEKDGLIILEARYGPIDAPDAGIDVALPLQALVLNSQLIIPANRSKAGLVGFYDPSVGSRKELMVRYSFQRRTHTVTVSDLGALSIPLREHAID